MPTLAPHARDVTLSKYPYSLLVRSRPTLDFHDKESVVQDINNSWMTHVPQTRYSPVVARPSGPPPWVQYSGSMSAVHVSSRYSPGTLVCSLSGRVHDGPLTTPYFRGRPLDPTRPRQPPWAVTPVETEALRLSPTTGAGAVPSPCLTLVDLKLYKTSISGP